MLELIDQVGGGLHGLLSARGDGVSGIVNGIDVDEWSPAKDPHIARHYDHDTVEHKVDNKRAVQEEVGLPVRDEVPLLGVVSRLTHQKGLDLLLPALARIDRELQLVVLGSVIDAGLLWLAIVGVMLAVVGAFYYLRVIWFMYFVDPVDDSPLEAAPDLRLVISANGLGLLALGVFTGVLLNLCARLIS